MAALPGEKGRIPPREAEAYSLRETMIWTSQWRTTKCIFETDAKVVVDAIHAGGGNSNFHTIIEGCVETLKHFEEVLVVFNHRSANKVAHMLAQVTGYLFYANTTLSLMFRENQIN